MRAETRLRQVPCSLDFKTRHFENKLLFYTDDWMFSSDRNINIIEKIIGIARHYFGLQCEYVKLGAIEKTVRLITALVIVAVMTLIIILTLIFLSLAATVWLASHVGYAGAFCIVGLFYLVAFLIFLLFKGRLIERPLVRFLTNLLMEK